MSKKNNDASDKDLLKGAGGIIYQMNLGQARLEKTRAETKAKLKASKNETKIVNKAIGDGITELNDVSWASDELRDAAMYCYLGPKGFKALVDARAAKAAQKSS